MPAGRPAWKAPNHSLAQILQTIITQSGFIHYTAAAASIQWPAGVISSVQFQLELKISLPYHSRMQCTARPQLHVCLHGLDLFDELPNDLKSVSTGFNAMLMESSFWRLSYSFLPFFLAGLIWSEVLNNGWLWIPGKKRCMRLCAAKTSSFVNGTTEFEN